MSRTSVEPFVISHESEADDFLTELLDHSEYRSMEEVEYRAQRFIKDERIRAYFMRKAEAMLVST